jgi:hypothetical protein
MTGVVGLMVRLRGVRAVAGVGIGRGMGGVGCRRVMRVMRVMRMMHVVDVLAQMQMVLRMRSMTGSGVRAGVRHDMLHGSGVRAVGSVASTQIVGAVPMCMAMCVRMRAVAVERATDERYRQEEARETRGGYKDEQRGI